MIENTKQQPNASEVTQESAEASSAQETDHYGPDYRFRFWFRRRERRAHFSQSAIDAQRDSPEFQAWNAEFESLIARIRRQVSPRDIRPLLDAGAKQRQLLTLLAFVVYDSDECLSVMLLRRKQMSSLASQLLTVYRHATRLVKDPFCDGRFWLALDGFLSWDEVPISGTIESGALERIQALAVLLDQRAKALGSLSRELRMLIRRRGIRDLLTYVWLSTRDSGKNFDREISYLLSAAFRAAGKERYFTPDQLMKFRQRQLPNLSQLPKPSSSVA